MATTYSKRKKRQRRIRIGLMNSVKPYKKKVWLYPSFRKMKNR
jgi:hypothetical protein